MLEQHKLRVIKPSTSEYQTISNAIVAKALPRQKEYFIRDNQLKGFYVRVKPSGKKLMVFKLGKTEQEPQFHELLVQ